MTISSRISGLTIKAISLTAIAAAILFLTNPEIASAQQIDSIPAVIENGIFQSTEDGFRLEVPEEWVVQDIANADPIHVSVEQDLGYGILALICPQNESLPGIGGIYNCEQSDSAVQVMRYLDLSNRPEFAVIQEPANVTLDDLLAFIISEFQEDNEVENIQIVNSSEMTVNVTNPENQGTTISTVPAKLVEMTYQGRFALADTRGYYLLAIAPDQPQVGGEQAVTGYRLAYEDPAATVPSGGPPARVQQIFDSFELLAPSSSPVPSSAMSITPQQQGEQQQLQQLQNQGASVSTVPGSSSLTTDAYAPNPLQVSRGGTVTWTNDDSQPHTVTSGDNATPDAIFDSGIMAPRATFDHTFTEAGEYPYFCLLHPNMVGTISVS